MECHESELPLAAWLPNGDGMDTSRSCIVFERIGDEIARIKLWELGTAHDVILGSDLLDDWNSRIDWSRGSMYLKKERRYSGRGHLIMEKGHLNSPAQSKTTDACYK